MNPKDEIRVSKGCHLSWAQQDVTDMGGLSVFHNIKCELPLKEIKRKKKVN